MKLLVDMNLSPDWIEVFASQGLQSLHWATVGDSRASDTTIMNWARENGYVVFTHDLDFGALLPRQRKCKGQVLFKFVLKMYFQVFSVSD